MANVKIQINSNATKQMKALVDKLDTFPNRIASAQQSALHRSVEDIYTRLGRISMAAFHLKLDIQPSGALGYKLSVSPPPRRKIGKSGRSPYYAAVIFIKGRPGGQTLRSKSGKKMKLRQASVRDGYPKYLQEAKLSSMPSNEARIKQEMRESVLKNLEYAIKRFGFGPRGGATGLEDLPRIRSRAGG